MRRARFEERWVSSVFRRLSVVMSGSLDGAKEVWKLRGRTGKGGSEMRRGENADSRMAA